MKFATKMRTVTIPLGTEPCEGRSKSLRRGKGPTVRLSKAFYEKKRLYIFLIPWVNTARRRIGSHLRKHAAWSSCIA